MKKKKTAGILRLFLAYGLGFGAWLSGFHCIEVNPQGNAGLSKVKIWKHLLKVFVWAFGISFIFHLPWIYSACLNKAPDQAKVLVLLALVIFFIYIRMFWPWIFSRVLPGHHMFFCPQCYQRQTFRFLPVSFLYGFWVTYLCTYCYCLVNGWGEQVFYPIHLPYEKLTSSLAKSIPLVLTALALGIICFELIWKNFSVL